MEDILIYAVGSAKNRFKPLDDSDEEIRSMYKKFYVDQEHQGDNIDYLNKYYSEGTAIYHLIHNNDNPILGCSHYRTYLYEDDLSSLMKPDTIRRLINEEGYDMLVSAYDYENGKDGVSLRKNLSLWLDDPGIKKLLQVAGSIDKGFQKAIDDFIKLRGGWHCGCCQFIGKAEVVKECWDFLINLCQEYDKVCPLGKLRRDGYLLEFCFGAWLVWKGVKFRKCRMVKHTKDFKGKPQAITELGHNSLHIV